MRRDQYGPQGRYALKYAPAMPDPYPPTRHLKRTALVLAVPPHDGLPVAYLGPSGCLESDVRRAAFRESRERPTYTPPPHPCHGLTPAVAETIELREVPLDDWGRITATEVKP